MHYYGKYVYTAMSRQQIKRNEINAMINNNNNNDNLKQ